MAVATLTRMSETLEPKTVSNNQYVPTLFYMDGVFFKLGTI